jgi:hypothetical protein
MAAGNCPICDSSSWLNLVSDGGRDYHKIRCRRCGDYVITDVAKDYVERALQLDSTGIDRYLTMGDPAGYRPEVALGIEVAKAANGRGIDVPRSIMSHVLRKRTDKRAPITCEILAGVLKNNSLPKPAEQANNLISYLDERQSNPGMLVPIRDSTNQENICGPLGVKTGKHEWEDLQFIITSLKEQQLLRVAQEWIGLTFAGWQKAEELKRSVKESRRAFVAMEFPNLGKTGENYFFQNTLLDKYLVPAVKQTGYELANALRSEPKAGNLHARLEVEIRAARFVVAEISHHNNEAYWEAGFARGLEKPVIYMYNKIIGKSDRPHFDVGSDLYIPWEEDKPEKAADDLKAVIRATLFGEAVMDD